MLNGIPVVLGTALFGTTTSKEDSYLVLDKYASLGGRVIDTANMYACWLPQGKGGESESVIGNLDHPAQASGNAGTAFKGVRLQNGNRFAGGHCDNGDPGRGGVSA